MTHLSERYLKTGDDPRTLPDYAALRDELRKLTHPARPDVNWRYAQKLCLSLFEQNGVELQTAAWYLVVRMQLAGLHGLNEGLSILEALIMHRWGHFWPQQINARMEILSSLSKRIHQMMRTLPLSDSDLSELYRAEQYCSTLGAILQRLELKHLSQFDALRTLMHNSAERLESSRNITGANPCIPQVLESEPVNTVKWVYVSQPETRPNVDVVTQLPPATKPWKFFVAGMFVMLLAGSAALWGWQSLQRTIPLRVQLDATIAPLPVPLSALQLQEFRTNIPLPEHFINDTEQQLTRLNNLPLEWPVAYAQQLVRQVQVLFPQDAAAKQLIQTWQQQLNAAALPADAMTGWHEGMTKLQQLSNKLGELDEKRGKYMTVSELKSAVYSTIQAFNRSVPAEEQLRRYTTDTASEIQLRQIAMALEQLQKRYFLLKLGHNETEEL